MPYRATTSTPISLALPLALLAQDARNITIAKGRDTMELTFPDSVPVIRVYLNSSNRSDSHPPLTPLSSPPPLSSLSLSTSPPPFGSFRYAGSPVPSPPSMPPPPLLPIAVYPPPPVDDASFSGFN